MASDSEMYESMQMIAVRVMSARNLRILSGTDGKYSPFAKVMLHSAGTENFMKTGVDEGGGRNPSWNEKLVLPVLSASDNLRIEIHENSENASSCTLIGETAIPIRQFNGGQVASGWYPLSCKMGACGEVHLRIQMNPPIEDLERSEVEVRPVIGGFSPTFKALHFSQPASAGGSPSLVTARSFSNPTTPSSTSSKQLDSIASVLVLSPAPAEYQNALRRRSPSEYPATRIDSNESLLRLKRPCTDTQSVQVPSAAFIGQPDDGFSLS